MRRKNCAERIGFQITRRCHAQSEHTVIELSEVRAIEGGGLGMLVIPAVVAESTKFAKFKRLSRPPLFVKRVFVERNIFSYHLFDGKVFLHVAPRSCWLNA